MTQDSRDWCDANERYEEEYRNEWSRMSAFPLQKETLKILWNEGLRCQELANLQNYGII